MKNLLLFLSLFIAAQTTHAQTYSQSRAKSNANTPSTLMGVRLGTGTMGSDLGLTIQHQFDQNSYVEGIGTLNKYDVRLTGLYQYHQPLSYRGGLTWFMGGGMHVGKVRKSVVENLADLLNIDLGNEDPKSIFLGIDAVAGIQYKFPGVPLNASVDIKPAYNFNHHPKPFEVGASFSLRWHFGSGGGKGSSNGSSSGKSGGYGTSGGSKGGSQTGKSGDGRVKTTTPPTNPSPQTQPRTSPTPSPKTTPQTNPSSPKVKIKTKPKTTPTQKPTPIPKPSGDNDGSQNGKGSNHGESWEDPPKDN